MKASQPALSAALAFVAGSITVLLLTSLGMLQWQSARWEVALRTRLDNSTARTEAIGAYLSALRDVETGQRGYLVTSDPAFLQPFEQAMKALPGIGRTIRLADWGTPQRKQIAEDLLTAGSARTNWASGTIELIQNSGRPDAIARIKEGTGKRMMDRARALADRLSQSELASSQALVARSLADRRERQRQIYMVEIAGLLSLGVLMLVLSHIVKDLRSTSAVLRDFATRQAAILEGATDGMMMLDERGRIESANQAAEALFGHPASAMIGKSNLSLFKNPPPEELSQAYLRRLASGQLDDNRQVFEGARGDGSSIEAEVVTTPIRLADGLHFLAVARDATERRQVERMKDEFVATVSHELRTPLTSVAGSLGLILGGAAGDIGGKATRLVQIAYNNCNRLVRLINDLLDIEKIESGKVVLSLQPLALAGAVEGAVSSLASYAESHSVAIAVEPIPADWKVVADPDRLTQVLTNLLSNAVKFSPPGETVSVSAAPVDHGRIRIAVTDRGPGISAEFRDRIFQKFAQADSTDTRQKGGTGLGLSIVKELVERMDGAVGFDSEEGKGARFFVDLPAIARLPSGLADAEHLGRMDKENAPQILHIDDDPDTLRLVASAFEGRAIVRSSPSVEEARATIDRYAFDAVILDIAMPDGNGLDLVDAIRQKSSPPIPIILYTALDPSSDEPRQLYARLTKSKDSLGRLVRTVERAMKKEKATDR